MAYTSIILKVDSNLFIEFVFDSGNDNIHLLTSDGRTYTLRVDLEDFDNNTAYAKYSDFGMDSSTTNYTLTSLGTYNGTAGKQLLQRDVVSSIG
jgi:hypothetical protein